MKKFLLSLMCLVTMAIPSVALTKTYQLCTDKTELLNPDNQFIMLTSKAYNGALYGALGTTTTTMAGKEVLKIDEEVAPELITIDDEGLAVFSFKANGDLLSLYEVTKNNFWGLTGKTNMANSKSPELPNGDDYLLEVSVGDKGVTTITSVSSAAANRQLLFQKGIAIKSYASSNANNKDYQMPIFYKEVVVETSVDPVEISYELEGAEGIVTLSCPTENATIFYGFSEEEMTNEYTEPFTVTEDCTVYAYAKVGEEKSITKSLNIKLPYTNFKDVIAKAKNGDEVHIIGNFLPIYQTGNYLILTDGTSNILVYNHDEVLWNINEGSNAKISDIKAKVSIYSNLFELTDATMTQGGDGCDYQPIEVTDLSALNYTDNLFDMVVIKGCTISGKEGKSATLSLNGSEILLYDTFGFDEIKNGEGFDVTGFVWRNKDNTQIVPCKIEGGAAMETVKTPVISPSKYELKENEQVSISSATPDAKIYYTLDGTDPTEESILYESPFDFTGDVTVKAIAYADDMLPSEIAEKKYHVFDPTCNIITPDNHDDNGKAPSYNVPHNCVVDEVEYLMLAVHNKDRGLQMNSDGRTCFVAQNSRNEDYVVSKITVDFNEADTDKNIPLIVRGANTPFTHRFIMDEEGNFIPDSTDNKKYLQDEALENIKTNGVKIGVITKEETSIEFPKDYKYFVIYPEAKGAIYMNSITIEYREKAEIAPAPELTAAIENGFDNDDESLKIPALPSHEDWTAMYQVNDDEPLEAEVDDETIHEIAISPASHHSIKIWYEHYNGEDKTEPTEYHYVTAPQVEVIAPEEDAEDKTVTITCGNIGEGVKVYFTLDGSDPIANLSTFTNEEEGAEGEKGEEPSSKNVITKVEDLSTVYCFSADDDKVIKVMPMKGENLPKITLKAQAIHEESGKVSSVYQHEDEIDIPAAPDEIVTDPDPTDPTDPEDPDEKPEEGDTSAVNEIQTADGGNVKYYNLRGERVTNPEKGVFIMVKNGKARKVVR